MSTFARQCRVCLNSDLRMYSIENIELKKIYEKLANTKINTEDRLPKTICYICYSQLQRCHRFAKTAQQAEKQLRNLLNSSNMPHNLPKLNLANVINLSVTVAQTEDYLNHESLQNSGDMHNDNYYCFHEEPPLVKLEPNVKIEIEEEEEVETEMCRIETDNGAPMSKPDPIKRSGSKKVQFSCHFCKKMLHSNHLYQRHLKIHEVKKSLSCTCGKPFSKLLNLRKHLAKCTNTNFSENPILACSECNEVYTDMDEYETHFKTHLEKRLFCSLCGKKYETTNKLHNHMKTHTDLKLYKCDVCDKSFKQQSHLTNHRITHKEDRPFGCDLCGKTYPVKGSLKDHMKSHTGERPFLCNTCGLSFAFKSVLNTHIRKVHIEVKAFPCKICNLSFNQEATLMGHMKRHTKKITHYCHICHKGFTSACNLKNHMDVHSTERPYLCNRCGKGYKRPDHLKDHLRIIKCIGVATC